ncbi:MAG: type II toxin-antitoxin system CcdA family antitoxin [Gammaproteobacteria bacterium]
MNDLYNHAAPKKATNLSINADLLAKSRELKLNLSATLERALENELAANAAKEWATENKAAIKAYNEMVEEHGCFGDHSREF